MSKNAIYSSSLAFYVNYVFKPTCFVLELKVVPPLSRLSFQASTGNPATPTGLQRANKRVNGLLVTNADGSARRNPVRWLMLKHQRGGTDQLWYKTWTNRTTSAEIKIAKAPRAAFERKKRKRCG
jgi:hypothetical protein